MVTINNSINNTVGASNSGVTNTLTVTNPSDTASSQAQILTTVGGTSSGDVWQQFSIGSTTSMALGLDNSDSDKLKITYAASASIDPSSGTSYFEMTPTTGAVTFQAASPANAIGILSQPTTGSVASGYRALRGANNSSNAAASTIISIANDVASSEAGITIQSSTGSGSGASPSFASKLGLFANAQLDGIVYSVQKNTTATHEFYTSISSTATLVKKCTSAGEWTMPLQPAFLAYLSSTVLNVTGDGTIYTIAYDAESFDQGSDFAANTFTVPVTGKYMLTAVTQVAGLTTATTPMDLDILVNGAVTLHYTKCHSTTGTNDSISVGGLVSLTAGQTVTVTLTVFNSTKVVDVAGSATGWGTYFSGYLVA